MNFPWEHHMKHLNRFLVSSALLFSLSSTAFAFHEPRHDRNDSKLSADVAAFQQYQTLPVIIQYKQDTTQQQELNVILSGGSVKRHMHSIHSMSADVPAYLLSNIAADPNIAYISIDRKVGAREVPFAAAEYTIEPINAPSAWWQGYLGTGVGVAVIDSGINAVDDLSLNPLLPVSRENRIVYSENFVTTENTTADLYGHGTHVAGLIAGNGADSTGKHFFRTFYGSAPNANLINLRVLDSTGAGTDSAVIAAIERAIALKTTYNIRVINLSLGRPIFENYAQDPLCQAVEQAWQAGMVVVVAAGNDGRNLNLNPEGYGTINAPGNDPYVLTVGAMRTMQTPSIQDDNIASYSSKGPSFLDQVVKPDVVAPGNLVSSLLFSNDPLQVENPTFVTPLSFYQSNGNGNKSSSSYFPLSGTSMATGIASGAIADLIQAAPSLSPDQVKALVMQSAAKSQFPATSSVTASGVTYVANYDVFTVGAGYLDINAAIGAALNSGNSLPSGTAMSPIATFDPSTGNTYVVTDQTALWGRSNLFSASSVYGANAFLSVNGSTALWGRTALWSDSDPNAFTALWGQTAIWGKGTPDATTALWGKTAIWGKSSTDAPDSSDATSGLTY
jgi:serine protease AprX